MPRISGPSTWAKYISERKPAMVTPIWDKNTVMLDRSTDISGFLFRIAGTGFGLHLRFGFYVI